MAKFIVIVFLIAIIASMASALLALMRDKGEGMATVRALTVRIGLSVTLFILLFVMWGLGWIQPHGLG